MSPYASFELDDQPLDLTKDAELLSGRGDITTTASPDEPTQEVPGGTSPRCGTDEREFLAEDFCKWPR